MLGIGLFFVGITLIINGWGSLLKIDHRSLALINLFTGSLSFIINILYTIQGSYYEAGTGFLLSARRNFVFIRFRHANLWYLRTICCNQYDSLCMDILANRR